jgi:RNA polymerase sigma-70 factor (ECF subfamily)
MIGPAFESVLVMARGGDDQAFATLWRDLNPAVVRYLRLAAPEAAEDLASETWLEIARTFGRFAGDERGFRVWVLTIARSRMLGWRRRMARRPAVPMAPEELPERVALDNRAAIAVESDATRRALALIAQLPADQAEVVMLRVVAGLDVAEVAQIVGKRPGTVRVLSHRGLRRLVELSAMPMT